ncbi:MAG: YIP1 family protein [Acidobacteriota bacterium]
MSPGEAFSRLRQDGDYIWPLIFGLLFGWFGAFFNQIWNVLFGEAMRGMMGGFQGIEGFESFAVYTGTNVLSAVVSLMLFPIFFLIGIFIGSGILHLCLMVVGATEASDMGFEGTYKVVAYSQIANLLAVIPLFGSIFGLIASLVLNAIGFTHVHKTTQGKAIVAVLIPVALCCLCCGALIALTMAGGFAAALAGG